jgi:ABC-type transport system substrate-binding protein
VKLRAVGIAIAALIGGGVMGAVTPGSIGAQPPGTLVVAQSAAVTALDPAGSSTAYPSGYEAALLVYDGLVRFTDEMEIAPDLATAWSVARDGRTWTFKIRREASFQDGAPVTAQAIASDLQRQANPATNQADRSLWDPIASVSAADASTVQIMTRQPYAALLNTLAHGSALIASSAAVEKWGAEYKLHPVGSGPYMVDRWDVGTQLEVRRNPQYWGAPPAYGRIVLRAVTVAGARVALLQSGQAQVAADIPPESVDELRRVSGAGVIVRPASRTFGMGINLNRPTLQDLRVREALNYAVNKELLVQALFRGYGSVLHSPIAPETAGYAGVGPWPYDPPKARRLLDEAGWKPAPPIGVRIKDGKSLEVTLLTPQGIYPRDVEVVETMADYLRNVGFGPHFIYAGPAAFWDNLLVAPDQYKWDLVLFGFNASNGDAGYHLDTLYRSNPDRQHRPRAWNVTWYSNPQVDAWLSEGEQAMDPNTRARAYAGVQRQAWGDAPYLWLYAEDVILGTRGVSGVHVLPIGVASLTSAHP